LEQALESARKEKIPPIFEKRRDLLLHQALKNV